MKKILSILLPLLFASVSQAATIQWYSQQPQTLSLAPTDVFSIESPLQTGYKYVTFDTLQSELLTPVLVWTNTGSFLEPITMHPMLFTSDVSAGDPSNLYLKFNIGSDSLFTGQSLATLQAQYFTATGNAQSTLTMFGKATNGNYGQIVMLCGGSSAGVAQLTLQTNAVSIFSVSTVGLVSSYGYQDNSLTEGYLVGVGPSGRLIQTNVDQVITNNYFQLISGNKVTVNNVYTLDITATNGFYIYTNTWANSPTGTVDLRIEDQYVQTYTPLSVTGFTSKSNRVAETVVMTITNASSTNIGVFLDAGIKLDTRTNSCTVSNGSFGILTIRYHPVGLTNAIYKQW